MVLVKTGDKIVRGENHYEVLIADDNIFVIGKTRYDEKEGCSVVNYDKAEIYANQSEINTLNELGFRRV